MAHIKILYGRLIYDAGIRQAQSLWWKLGRDKEVEGGREQSRVKGFKEIYLYVVNNLLWWI